MVLIHLLWPEWTEDREDPSPKVPGLHETPGHFYVPWKIRTDELHKSFVKIQILFQQIWDET